MEVRTSGPRSWPNLLAGVADMWLHPAAWPARSAAQRQARVVAMAVIVTGIGWLAAHLMIEDTRGLPRMLDVCAVAVVAGLLLARAAPGPGHADDHRAATPAPARRTGRAGRRRRRRRRRPRHRRSFIPPIRLTLLACWWVPGAGP
ncbi:hypothetical protein OHS18_12590 [Amycolatopsis sp. NBC_00355]|uniref:hypothetical protein n=1 Tax=Amycolatopsis sp. NBC_00355 TaxID=2975957 RepID=UPI002E26F680